MVFIVAIFLSASVGLKNFKLDASSDALVIEGDEAFRIYRETGEIFGNSDFLIITFTPKTDLFSPQSLATIQKKYIGWCMDTNRSYEWSGNT